MNNTANCLLATLAGITVLVTCGYWFNFSSGIDDAHITYWAGYAWSTWGAPLNYNLDRVEQSSSILHVALIALAHYLTGTNPVFAGHVISLMASAACLPLLWQLARKLQLNGPGAILVCTSTAAFSYWTYAGLETPLVALLLLAVTLLFTTWHTQGGKTNAVVLIIACLLTQLSRPEIPLFFPALGFALFILGKDGFFLLVNISITLLVVFLRKIYYGDFFPQPVYAKVSLDSVTQLLNGLHYVISPFTNPWLCLQAIIGVIAILMALRHLFAKNAGITIVMVTLLVCVHTIMIIAMGGDWMENNRFWMPVTPFYAILCIALVSHRTAMPGIVITIVVIITIMNLASTFQAARNTFSNTDAAGKPLLDADQDYSGFSFFEKHSRDNVVNIPTLNYLSPLVNKLLTEKPTGITLLSGQMGMISYHLAREFPGKINFIDRNGLVERTFTHCAVFKDRQDRPASINEALAKQHKFSGPCAIKQPDVIFDIWLTAQENDVLQIFEKRGYAPVFIQHGHLTPDMSQIVGIKQEMWVQIGKPAVTYHTVNYKLFTED